MKKQLILCTAALLATAAFAKLPTPVLNDEAKAKAAEAAAKTAHGNKVANYQLCKSMDRTAAHFFKTAKAAGKETKPATDTGACADPGAFVWPAPASPAAGAAATPVAAAAPAKPTAAPVKK
jgi:hypothetical protein